jgi:hypothetical protein
VGNRELGNPDIFLIHVVTNNLRRNDNLDFVMGEVYELVHKEKVKFPKLKLILSGVLRRRDASWRRGGALNDVAKTLGD